MLTVYIPEKVIIHVIHNTKIKPVKVAANSKDRF